MSLWQSLKAGVASGLYRLLHPALQRSLGPEFESIRRHQDQKIEELQHVFSDQQISIARNQLLHAQHHRDELRLSLADIRLEQMLVRDSPNPSDWEMRCFSQWGEDGLLQFLIRRLPEVPKTFVEIGVDDYLESNTRFLLLYGNWRGCIVDCNDRHLQTLERSGMRWMHDIEPMQCQVNRDNINEVLDAAGFIEGIGLLSVDIDGMDYWVWEAIANHRPHIVAMEYNSVFGRHHAIVVPYESSFNRTRAHPSNLYYGASLSALLHLARRLGYRLICGNTAGNNAFFVREEWAPRFSPLTPAEAYRPSLYRESRDEAGRLTYVSAMAERLQLIDHLPVVDVENDARVLLRDLNWEGAWVPAKSMG